MGLFGCFSKPKPLEQERAQSVTVSVGTEATKVAEQATQTDAEPVAVTDVQAHLEVATDASSPGSARKPPLAGESWSKRISDGSSGLTARRVSGLSSSFTRRGRRSDQGDQGEKQDSDQPLPDLDDPKELNRALYSVFLEFARFGTRSDAKHLDSFRFMKLCRECCLTTSLPDTKCVDLIFYKEAVRGSRLCAVFREQPTHLPEMETTVVKTRKSDAQLYMLHSKCKEVPGNKMSFVQFKRALTSIADLLGVEVAEVKKAIALSVGPLVNNITLPCYVRLHDDAENGGNARERRSDGQEAEQAGTAQAGAGEASSTLIQRLPGTYPAGLVAASDGSVTSGFAPDSKPRLGSPRGGC